MGKPCPENLAGWVHEPTVQDPVLDAIHKIGRPVTLTELVEITGFKNTQLARVLPRLHTQGRVRRWKEPWAQVVPHRNGTIMTVNKTRWVYEGVKD